MLESTSEHFPTLVQKPQEPVDEGCVTQNEEGLYLDLCNNSQALVNDSEDTDKNQQHDELISNIYTATKKMGGPLHEIYIYNHWP